MSEQEQALVLNEGLSLAEGKYAEYSESIMEGYKKRNGHDIPTNVLATTAIMLENTNQYMAKMDETTKVVNLGNFTDYGLGIVAAMMPSLIAQDIASVQPLMARTGEVWYMDFKYGSNKGPVAAGDTMFSSLNGPNQNANTHYTDEVVENEMLGSGDGSSTSLVFYANYNPIKPGTISITNGSNIYSVDSNGVVTGSGIAAGSSVDFTSGKITLKFSAAPAVDVDFTGTYQFDMLSGTNTLPEVDLSLTSSPIQARPRKLRARWLFDAAFELQTVHGVDADVELTIALASEVRHEIDGEIMNDMFSKAALTGYTWSKTPPDGISNRDHKDTFLDKLTEMSNDIFSATMRAQGNFIIAGMGVCNIIETLGDQFVPAPEATFGATGPHYIGMLAGRYRVYKNPYYANNNFLVGYRGTSYLEGGYIYAPFLPLYTTPTMMTDDFLQRKGVATQYGKKLINPKFYAVGQLTN